VSKVCMVIPTYNEAENLPKLVGALEEERPAATAPLKLHVFAYYHHKFDICNE
jgi:hypothetical protein